MTSTERTLDSSRKYSSPLNSILEIAEKIGLTNEETSLFSSKTSSSIQLVNLLCELLSLRDQNEKILHELTKIKDSQSSFDLVNESELEKKIKIFSDFSNHIESIISNKQDLLMRLKDPFVGENINIEPQYHKDFAELFPLIAQSIASLSYDLESIQWFKSYNFADQNMNSQILKISSIIAIYGNYSDCLDRVRKTLKDIEDVQTINKGKAKI
ncbi:hypothetical protein Glove_265g20 [Diversispora epigaea]|uniref:Uncharacterized protein n=1 Tax=Diversispora epigaea TaxID=1348612 RepID=A0A397I587_9GLOM|nr:hypothetical protein Glove_265g20 [Diversispora epigaea]